jgi:hypothetical protein
MIIPAFFATGEQEFEGCPHRGVIKSGIYFLPFVYTLLVV